MSSKIEKMTANSSKQTPVPMKLFAAWEVDRTAPNCIARLCSLTITKLSILSPLPSDLTTLSLAVKMQSSKRTLRSHEIPVNSNNNNASNTLSNMSSLTSPNVTNNNNGQQVVMEADLDLNFSLQYPHFLKRDGNRLLILLQRRKKYKTRTILGYKTLAEGVIRMDAVLQKSMDMTIELSVSGNKATGRPGAIVATIRAERVSSIPVDHDNKNLSSVLIADRGNEYSDEDEDLSSGDDNEDAGGLMRSFAKARNYRKIDRLVDNDNEQDTVLGPNVGDSDSDFDNLGKDKANRTKISRNPAMCAQLESIVLKAQYLNEKFHKYAPRMDFLWPYLHLHLNMLHQNRQQHPDDEQHEDEVVMTGRGLEKGDHSQAAAMLGEQIKSADDKFLMQRNFKQKIVALLKRFKVPEEMEESVSRHPGTLRSGRELDELFQELESLSCGDGEDSGPDVDSLSIGSTPKPSLRPFFTNSRINLQDNIREESLNEMQDKLMMGDSVYCGRSSVVADRGGDGKNDSSGTEGMNIGDHDGSDGPTISSPPFVEAKEGEKKTRLFRTSTGQSGSGGNMKKKQSLSLTTTEPKLIWETCLSPTNIEPRKLLLDQLARTFATDENLLPESVILVGPPEVHFGNLVTKLTTILGSSRPIFSPHNTAEVKAILQALLNKIQKYCNSTAKPPTIVKVLLLGGDWLQGLVLRHYVELLAARPPDWINHIRFFIVSFGSSSISRYLSAIDASYGLLFGTDNWQQLCERAVALDQGLMEIVNRIHKYLNNTGPCTQIPIAEAMVNYKEEESYHIFVPFLSDVRLGCPEGPQLSLDMEESSQAAASSSILSSSPPNGRLSPTQPSMPNLQQRDQSQASPLTNQQHSPQESYELQIDYWPRIEMKEAKALGKTSDQSKNTIKSTFRSFQVWRLPPFPQAGEISNGLTLIYSTKEKKQKIMRLGKKKEKDRDPEKEQFVDSVARIICSPKQSSHPVPLRVYIDGTEWTGVKFFQLSAQWQTHVKNFPVALIGAPLAAPES